MKIEFQSARALPEKNDSLDDVILALKFTLFLKRKSLSKKNI